LVSFSKQWIQDLLDVARLFDDITLQFQEKELPNAHLVLPYISSLIHYKIDQATCTVWKQKIIKKMKKLVPKYLLKCVDMDTYICSMLCQPYRRTKFAERILDPLKEFRKNKDIIEQMKKEGNELWNKLGTFGDARELKENIPSKGLYNCVFD